MMRQTEWWRSDRQLLIVCRIIVVIQNFDHMPMADRVAMEELWQAYAIIIKESTFAIRQNK